MEFSICGQSVEISNDELHAHKLHAMYIDRAQRASSEFMRKYKGYQTWRNFVTTGPREGYEIIASEFDFAAKRLVREGKYGVTSDSLYDKYGEAVLEPWNDLVDGIVELMERTNDMANQARQARELRKATRGQVVGGGFGVSGAVKGMAMAGAANIASGSVHSVANAIGNVRTQKEIARQEAKLYADEGFQKSVCERLYTVVERIGACLAVEYGIDSDEVQPRNKAMAENLMQNYSMVPKKERLEVLLHALYCDKYQEAVYEHLLVEFEGAEAAAEIGRMFGMGEAIDRISTQALSKMIPSPQELSARSLDSKVELLQKYRKKRDRLEVKKRLPAEETLELSIIEACAPANWDLTPAQDIQNVLQDIQEKKRAYNVGITADIERTLAEKLLDAKTVSGKVYESVEKADEVRAELDHVLQLCKNMESKSYDDLIALQTQIDSDCKYSPYEYAGDMMVALRENIRKADIARRTFQGQLYKSVEDVQLAKDLREQATQLIDKCNFQSAQDVHQTRAQLVSLSQKVEPNCMRDYLETIESAYKRFCTYEGRMFGSIEEKQQVQAEVEVLQQKYLSKLEDSSIDEINEIRTSVSKETDICEASKQMFDGYCRSAIDAIIAKQEELKAQQEREETLRKVQELEKRFSNLDLTDRSRQNFKALTGAAKELGKYDAKYTQSILPPIQSAIQESRRLYDQEKELRQRIERLQRDCNILLVYKDIALKFLVYIVVAFAALIWLSGWFALLVAGGSIIAAFHEASERMDKYKDLKFQIKEDQKALKQVQEKINKH